MRKLIITCLICGLLMGCASTLTVKPDGTIIARDYAVRVKADGSKVYIPDRVFSFKNIEKFLGEIFGIVK